MRIAFAAAAALAMLLPVAAQAQDHGHSSRDRCLQVGQIYSWSASKDNRSLIVEDNWHHKFRVELMGYCPDLAFKERIGFKSFGGTDLSCLSAGDSVIDREMGMGTQRCPIRKVTPLPEGWKAPDEHDHH